jgi:hypothetical protein
MLQINAQPFAHATTPQLGEHHPEGVNALQWQLASPQERQALLEVLPQPQPSNASEKISSTLRDMAWALPAPLGAIRLNGSSPSQLMLRSTRDNLTP